MSGNAAGKSSLFFSRIHDKSDIKQLSNELKDLVDGRNYIEAADNIQNTKLLGGVYKGFNMAMFDNFLGPGTVIPAKKPLPKSAQNPAIDPNLTLYEQLRIQGGGPAQGPVQRNTYEYSDDMKTSVRRTLPADMNTNLRWEDRWYFDQFSGDPKSAQGQQGLFLSQDASSYAGTYANASSVPVPQFAVPTHQPQQVFSQYAAHPTMIKQSAAPTPFSTSGYVSQSSQNYGRAPIRQFVKFV